MQPNVPARLPERIGRPRVWLSKAARSRCPPTATLRSRAGTWTARAPGQCGSSPAATVSGRSRAVNWSPPMRLEMLTWATPSRCPPTATQPSWAGATAPPGRTGPGLRGSTLAATVSGPSKAACGPFRTTFNAGLAEPTPRPTNGLRMMPVGEGDVGIEVLEHNGVGVPAGIGELGRNVRRKVGTTRGSPSHPRTATASRISRRAVKSRRAREWGG
jgi:hypothetical protein